VIEKHDGGNIKYFASTTSSTPNRLFIYEIDKLAHLDSLNAEGFTVFQRHGNDLG
jgi:hypothetical protein